MQGWFYRGTTIAAIALGLAACQTTTGGGGGGGGAAPTTGAFDAAYNRVQGLGPSTDMPTRLDATYRGQARVDLTDPDTRATIGEAFADLTLNIDWTDTGATASNVWTGEATNIQGTADGTPFAATGSLTVDTASSGVTRVETTPVPGVTVATGGFLINMTGQLTVDGETEFGAMQLGGNFYGPGASAMSGTANLGISDTVILLPGNGDLIGGGFFYAER